jgi:hypothetical protein
MGIMEFCMLVERLDLSVFGLLSVTTSPCLHHQGRHLFLTTLPAAKLIMMRVLIFRERTRVNSVKWTSLLAENRRVFDLHLAAGTGRVLTRRPVMHGQHTGAVAVCKVQVHD